MVCIVRVIGQIYRKGVIFCLFICIGLFIADKTNPLPLPNISSSRVVLAEDGTPLWRFTNQKGVWRYPVTIQQVSPYYIQALLAYEDRWFYHHPGINPVALGRAFGQDIYHHHIVSGGSTLSMQVARIVDPCPHTYLGKIGQIFRALQLEWHLNKEQILTIYLNHVSYGGMVEGIAAASWTYLGKPPDQLTKGEAALLAVLPQAPSRLRPDRYPERAKKARDKVLERLAQFKVWSKRDIEEIKGENVLLSERQIPQLAPLLARRLSLQNKDAVIHSTINIDMQRHLEELLENWKNRLPPHNSAAILVVDSATMQVKAYLGSVDLQDKQRFGYVDMVTAIRSPGSILKPFLYGLAMDEGLIHSESLLQDVPRQSGHYRPEDFSSSFVGPVSVSQALRRSLNLPAVQVLEVYGARKFYGKLTGAGIGLKLPQMVEPNLAIILGGIGTSLENVVTAYSAFARKGKVAMLRFKNNGSMSERPLLSEGSAWVIRKILEGESPLDSNFDRQIFQQDHLAWKTGTSYGYRDAWAVGVGKHYIMGVWIGRPDGTPVAGQYGIASATPLLFQVYDMVRNQASQTFSYSIKDHEPATVSVAQICWPSGQILPDRDQNCRQKRTAWIINHIVPPTLEMADQPLGTGVSQTVWINERGFQVSSDCPGAIEKKIDLWPIALEPWLPLTEQRHNRLPTQDLSCPSLSMMESSSLSIIGVKNGDHLQLPPSNMHPLTLKLSALGGTKKKWWFLNGYLIQETDGNQSFDHVFHNHGKQQLTVMDEMGKTALAEFTLN